jgi:hypothetical protein
MGKQMLFGFLFTHVFVGLVTYDETKRVPNRQVGVSKYMKSSSVGRAVDCLHFYVPVFSSKTQCLTLGEECGLKASEN